jgi:DNA repair protein RadC
MIGCDLHVASAARKQKHNCLVPFSLPRRSRGQGRALLARVAFIDEYFVATLAALLRESASPSLDRCAATWPSPSPGNSALTETNMSNITLYTNDENTATGIREASFEEILDCARRALAKRVRRGTGFTSPRVTADYLRVRLSILDHEVFCVIYLTKRHQFIACEDLFRGTIDGASVYPREVLKEAIKHNAAAVILAHNHPSGVAEPSQADLDITKQLKKVLDLVEIKVLDHIIIGGGDTVSFAERGLL